MTTYAGSYQTDSSTKLREAARLLNEVADDMDRNAPANIRYRSDESDLATCINPVTRSAWCCSCMHTKDKCLTLGCPRNPSSKNA